MPKVSVIMGVYNTADEEILSASIDSILNQTFTDFEFIICDDGSTDGTYKILEKISNKDDRIILIQNKSNKGLAYSLNKGIAIAKGEYIARQDADDYSHKSRIEKQVDFLDNNKSFAMVGTNINYFDETGIWGQYVLGERPAKKDFLFTNPFMHGTLMYRKQILNKCGNYMVSKETRRCEDYELFMRIYENGFVGANIQEKLYYFREDKNALARRKYIYRIDEVKVRYHGFKALGLMPKGSIYLIKPLIVGLIPNKILLKLKNRVYNNRDYRN